jgi:hypothetical protein
MIFYVDLFRVIDGVTVFLYFLMIHNYWLSAILLDSGKKIDITSPLQFDSALEMILNPTFVETDAPTTIFLQVPVLWEIRLPFSNGALFAFRFKSIWFEIGIE